MKHKGFTILEVSLVISVIGILAVLIVVSYRGMRARANDAVVAVDLAHNTKKLSLSLVDNGKFLDGTGLASSEYKVTLSKRSTYKFYGYCTAADGWGGPITEIIETAGTVDGKQYMYSSIDGYVKDVTSQMGTSTYTGSNTTSAGHPYKCWDFIKPGKTGVEFRDMVHYDGGVETGYVTILNP